MPDKKKILWVEDDTFLTGIIAQKLLLQGWELIPAANGDGALALARDKKPDIIILDILLPGMDGLEVLSKLKVDESTKQIPVLIFSNFDDKEKRDKAKELGAEGYFVKASVDLDTIVEEIQKILSH
jgi:DNA-binding response OmpR family regulator